mgnify:CR=1 FL=1
MYINKIDELVDKIIDDFYNNIFKKKDFAKISKDHNFVKYQLNINNILADYIKTINKKEIKVLLDSEDNVIKIIDIIKRYLAYYFFLVIGYFYEGKKETYINNIIEFTKNQSTFNYKINNFFNAENNSILIKYFEIVKNTVLLLELEPSKIQIAIKKPEFKTTIDFLNSLGQEFVLKNFKLENLGGRKEEQSHNIIKTIIVNELYYKIEKKDVYDIISSAEKKEGEFTFIDIVVPSAYYIDFNAIEDILTKNEIRAGYANELYKFVMENEHKFKFEKVKPDDKILSLFNSKIIVPVVDDFLLYHKDNEKYEKSHSQDQSKYKKKEDTKIRYIVSKIDSVSEYYSENVKKNVQLLKNIEKQFYAPLTDRKAILVNNNEEIKIITKLHNQGRRSIENNEYYNDLMNYRLYPYVNFKEFKDHGFSLQLNNTIDVVRQTSFINNSSRNYLQLRIGSKDQVLNVTGIMIPSQINPLPCIKTINITDATDIISKTNTKSNNGYKNTSKFLKHVIFDKKKHKTSIYWKFNPNEDTIQVDKYEQLSKLNSQDDVKLVISHLYDDLLIKAYGSIINQMDNYSELSFYNAYKIIKMHENKLFSIPKSTEFYNMIEKYIYQEKYEKSVKQYDKNEDNFGGLFGDIIKLPTYKNKSNKNIHTIKIVQDFIMNDVKIEKTDAEKIGAICQHFISWDNITTLRKNSPTDYTYRLYDFINQYVMENNDQDYVCKSCGTQLNIKKYITDGVYDKDSDKFITFNMPMEIPLEDIPEYEKYKGIIRMVDKYLENISSVASIPFYVGSSTTIKSRRKGIVKNIIDILLIHNKNMNKKYKERHDKVDKLYGINKELTNMFVFELDNSILVYSSKDKDFYKPIKHNNIIVYIMFLLILEVNKSQLLYMNTDKNCNYSNFDKYGHYMFENLKIIVNDKGDTVPIKNYKILCYLIYYIACLATKYRTWSFDSENAKVPKNKLAPLINKVIVHTFVDILNSVLEINQRKEKHFIYTSISNRFFLQLNTFYKDIQLSNTLKRADNNKMSALIDTKKFVISKIKSLVLTGEYSKMEYDSNNFNKCLIAKYFLKRRNLIKKRYYNANNMTNCSDGLFHDWKPKNKELVCNKCNEIMKTIKHNANESSNVTEQIKIQYLRRLADKFCNTGELHNIVYDMDTKRNMCKKCKYSTKSKLTSTELYNIEEIIKKNKLSQEIQNEKLNAHEEEKNEKHARYEHAILNQINDDYTKTIKNDNQFLHVNEFISLVESTIGKDVNINGENIFIKNDAYIIDHNHNGQPYDNPIIITDKDKIVFKRNHHFFGVDILYYTNLKGNKIDVFYDATSFILLGHKESNKDYIRISNTSKHITINYSLDSRIKLLGYSFKYIDIHERTKNIRKNYKDASIDFALKSVIADINRVRIVRLKRIISDIQRYIYRLIYNFEDKTQQEEEPSKNFMNKYYKKLNNIKIKDDNKRNKIFKDWEVISANIFMESLEDEVININDKDKFISTNELSKHDRSGNIILFYIMKELSKLIEYNNNKFTKATIVFFLIDVINKSFSVYNNDIMFKNNEIKRFNYIMNSSVFMHDIEQKGHGLDNQLSDQNVESQTEGFYGEIKDEDKDDTEIKEQLENDQEEQDALDVDTEIDYESGIDNYTF